MEAQRATQKPEEQQAYVPPEVSTAGQDENSSLIWSRVYLHGSDNPTYEAKFKSTPFTIAPIAASADLWSAQVGYVAVEGSFFKCVMWCNEQARLL